LSWYLILQAGERMSDVQCDGPTRSVIASHIISCRVVSWHVIFL